MDESVYDQLVGSIYSAALDKNCWSDTLTGLGRAFGGHVGAVMFIADGRGNCTRILGSADRRTSIDDYIANWAERDTAAGRERPARRRTAPVRPTDIARATYALPAGGICTDDGLVDRAALERTDFYRHHLARFDFHHALGAKIWHATSGSAVLSLSRTRRHGPFAEREVNRFRTLQPHLDRALAIGQRLAWVQAGGDGVVEGAEKHDQPLLVLDHEGLCGHANPAAEALLALGDGLRIVKRRIVASNSATNALLMRCIALAVDGNGRGARSGGAVAIPRPSHKPALALMICPVQSTDDVVLPRRPRAVVTIVDPCARSAPTSECLTSLFRLTPSEAAVAIGIGQGLELKDVAARLQLTTDSARQYLTRVYTKTNTRRQNDLSHLLTQIAMT